MTKFSKPRVEADLTVAEVAASMGYSESTAYRWESGEMVPRQAALEVPRSLGRSPPDGDFAFIDLFAGIGGMRKGFEAVGGKCVFTSEWDKYSQITYRANYPDGHNIAGDITEIDAVDIPSHDVLLAGFPCQPFSLAGVSKKNSLNRPHGFRDDAQGTLFFDVARIIEHHRPKAFLLENVKNLRNHDGGRTFAVIMNTLREELGYEVHARLIDARSVVPQHRERPAIISFFNAVSFTDCNRAPAVSA
jgi:DNA (cytosine-5)-methyltransferase 1